MKRYDAGIQGEQEAENALTRQGMTMRTRRYRAEDGEIRPAKRLCSSR